MNRRSFLSNLLAGAAAVLSVGQMPKVAEAAVAFSRNCETTEAPPKLKEAKAALVALVADARAEGYADGYTQATQRAESRVAEGLPITNRLLTFESMQSDCSARGCSLFADTRYSEDDPHQITHMVINGWLVDSEHYNYAVDSQENVLGRVDAWRQSLHQSGSATLVNKPHYMMIPIEDRT